MQEKQNDEISVLIYIFGAAEVFNGVFLMLSFFPRDVLDENWGSTESVFEGFLPILFDSQNNCNNESATLC